MKHTSYVRSLKFSPNGYYLISGSSDKNIIVWNASFFKDILILSIHSYSIYSIAFSKNGEYMASASSDKLVMLWKVS
jgi:WD40 repeat protein